MTIPTLPSAPLVTDIPADFNTKAFNWVAALDNWTTEANATGVAADADAATATSAAGTATTQAGTATTQAGIATSAASTATTQAGIATTKAGEANASAVAAAASAASINLNSIDINGGTIDGTVIGGSSAAAGSFTTLSATAHATASFIAASGALGSFPVAQGLYGYYSSGGVLGSYSNNAGTLGVLSLDGSSVAIRPNGSTVGNFTTTGLAVTGALSASGAVTFNGAVGTAETLLNLKTSFNNPSGEKSLLWSDATNALGRISVSYTSAGGSQMAFGSLYNGGYLSTDKMVLSNTGLAVTGALSATGVGSVGGAAAALNAFTINQASTYAETITNGSQAYAWRLDGTSLKLSDRTAFTEKLEVSSTGLAVTGALSATKKLTLTGIAATVKEASLVSGTTTHAAYHRLTNTGADGVLGIAGSGGSEILSSGSPYATQLYTVGATPLQFGTNSAVKATLDTSGNLGLGVTPSATWTGLRTLETANGVTFSGQSNLPIAHITANATLNASAVWTYNTTNDALRYELQADTGNHSWYTAPSGTAGNAITFTQAMTLDASGGLIIGHTSGGTADTNSFASDRAGYIVQNHVTGTATATPFAYFAYAGGSIGTITQSGTTAVLYNTTSDARLKENITDASDAASLIDALQVRQFDWKSDGSHQRYGFVAQELYEVAPEAVSKPQDPDEMMAVDYSKLVPMLVKEIQSLRARVAQLEGI